MGIVDIVLIAIALAMDCLAVSVACGIANKRFYLFQVIRMALLFAIFQGLMPLIGYFSAFYFKEAIEDYDHWFALIILFIMGLKMIREGVKEDEIEHEKRSALKIARFSTVLLMSFATSIDALATGIIFVPLDRYYLSISLAIIAVITFVFSILGAIIGMKVGDMFDVKIEIFGGLMLMGIGFKIFCQHIWFG